VEGNRESGEFGETGYDDFDAGSASVDVAESFGTAPIETSEMETVPNDFDMVPADFGAETEPTDSGTGPAESETGSADGDSEASEMAPAEIDQALEEIEKELAEVELALERLGDGSYGLCQTCGNPLSEDELETAPTGRFCRAHLPFAPG
jgi:RNA polymerase-binding transcription factor DksA